MVIVLVQALMSLVSDIMFHAQKHRYLECWYLFPDGKGEEVTLPELVAYFLTFFTLYSNLMPVSLYASMEVCNAAQAYFLRNDLEMYDKERSIPANVRSTNL